MKCPLAEQTGRDCLTGGQNRAGPKPGHLLSFLSVQFIVVKKTTGQKEQLFLPASLGRKDRSHSFSVLCFWFRSGEQVSGGTAFESKKDVAAGLLCRKRESPFVQPYIQDRGIVHGVHAERNQGRYMRA